MCQTPVSPILFFNDLLKAEVGSNAPVVTFI